MSISKHFPKIGNLIRSESCSCADCTQHDIVPDVIEVRYFTNGRILKHPKSESYTAIITNHQVATDLCCKLNKNQKVITKEAISFQFSEHTLPIVIKALKPICLKEKETIQLLPICCGPNIETLTELNKKNERKAV